MSIASRSSLVIALGFAFAGCGSAAMQGSSKRSENLEVKQDGAGALSLRMPKEKQGERLKTVLMTLERRCGGIDPGYPEPMPYPYDADVDVGVDAPAESMALRSESEEQGGEDKEEYVEPRSECDDASVEAFSFPYQEGKVVSLDSVIQGQYWVTVQLIAKDDSVLEQGSAWAYVAAGSHSYIEVQLEKYSENGGLDIGIIRADDRRYGDDWVTCGAVDSDDSEGAYTECGYEGDAPTADKL